MADLRIVDAPLIPKVDITGLEKIPTGGSGNYSISLDGIAEYTQESLDIADKADVLNSENGVKALLKQHTDNLSNPHVVTKEQIGLGNVDNTADADKPMSNLVQSAITTLDQKKADKTSVYLKTETYNKNEVDNALATKPNSSIVYTKTETNNLLNGKVSSVNGKTGTAITLNRSDLGISSDEVMQQWQKEARFIIDESGLNQQQINDKLERSAPIVSNNFNSIQSAIAASANGSEIFVSSGSHTESVSLNKSTVSGMGYSSIINVPANSYGFKVLQNLPNWDRTKLENMTIKGVTKDNNVGVLFDPDDAVAGRKALSFLSISNLDIAIKKPRGSIGNTYENMNIYECNYGIKANSVWLPQEMHSGNDTWRDFQIDTIAVYAFDYFDDTGGGAIHIKDGIIEYCNGGGIRLEYSDRYPPFIPPRISNVWFEQVAKASTIVRDGVTEVPRTIKLVNTDMCIIENCKLDNIELVNSTALAMNCRVDSTNMTIDSNSNLIVENAYLNGSVSDNVTISSIAKQSYLSSFGANLTLRGNPIKGSSRIPVGASVGVGITYRGNVGKKWSIDGTALVYATSILDNGSPCVELALQSGNNYVFPYVTTPISSWVVWGISAKQVGSLTGSFKFNMDYIVGDILLKPDEWVHSFGVVKSPELDMNLRAIMQPTSNGTIRFKDYFIASFESESEAIAFANSRMSIDTYPNSLQVEYNPPSLAVNETTSVNIDFLGVSPVDNISCSFSNPLNGVRLWAEVSSNNIITVFMKNQTTSVVDLVSGILSVKLL